MSKPETGIPVMVYCRSHNSTVGILQYTSIGPEISFTNGTALEQEEIITFGILEKDESQSLSLSPKDRVHFKPIICVKMGYSPGNNRPEAMYPPSTDGWIGNVAFGSNEAIFLVHELKGSEKKLLVIIDPVTGSILKSHKVQPYEISILGMKRDWIVYTNIFKDIIDSPILDILDSEPPSWELLSKFVQDVNIPNLSIGKTMKETLKQLVPKSFQENIRYQIMAFLAWIENADIPNIDPLEFNHKYRSADVFRQLATGHLRCLVDDVEPPPYVRILMEADRGLLNLSHRPQPEAVERNPWFAARFKLYELFPDWTGGVIRFAKSLNEKGVIQIDLPISKTEAQKSKQNWKDRFVMVTQGLIVRGHVFKESVGLKTMVYVGSAHKWPHRHLQYSARLGFETERQPYIQVMAFPIQSTEQIVRLHPTIHSVDWEMTGFNLDLYNLDKKKWSMNYSIIRKSLERSRSLSQLVTEFEGWKGKKPITLSKKDADVLDMISWGIHLGFANYKLVLKHYDVTKEELIEKLNNFVKQRVIIPQYLFSMEKLMSTLIIADGAKQRICSLTRSLLKNAPSANAMISNKGNTCHIITRIPEHMAFKMVTDLPTIALENGINLRVLPISAFAGYRNNLYQRLWKQEGEWNDDVSGLLSQTRLRSKDDC